MPDNLSEGANSHVNAAYVGDPGGRGKLTTPALVLDMDLFEANIAAAVNLAANAGMALRPHVKGQKCTAVAERLIAAGASGLACTTLAEAELMAQTSTPSLLITSPIVGSPLIDRLVALSARTPELLAVVDTSESVDAIGNAFGAAGRSIGLLVDIDVGQRRTGVADRARLLAVAQTIADAPHLRFAGVQAYYGHLQGVADYAERADRARAAQAEIVACVDELRQAGLTTAVVSGGGTGTAEIDARSGPFTELQPGSFAFMDAQYLAVQLTESGAALFRPALFVRGRVVSNQQPDRLTIDIGMKAMSTDGGPGVIVSPDGIDADYGIAGDEHGVIASGGKAPPLALGDAVEIIPGHCDTTVNLHAVIHAVRGSALEAIWPVGARGFW